MSEEQIVAQETAQPVRLLSATRFTRRQLLRTSAASTALGTLTLGGFLTACGSTGTTTPVTLTTGDWPFSPIPATVKKGETDPVNKAEVETLQNWLSQNKNVTLKATTIDTSTSQKLIAALAANTAPTWYGSGSVGDATTAHFAGSLGLAAETTQILQQYNVDSLLADYARPIWHATWNVDGKYYGLPSDFVSAGAGFFYRRDIVLEKGLAEPKRDWTWEDFRTFAKAVADPGKPAMGAPSYMIGYLQNSNLLDPLDHGGILGSVPVVNGNWHQKVNLTPWLSEWEERVKLYRTMVFEDKLIRQDATAYPWEGAAVAEMANGSYPIAPGFAFLLAISGYAPVTIPDMAKKYGKPIDELVGYVPYPNGSNGGFNPVICPQLGATFINPRLKSAAIDKAADLWLYMFYGQGYIDNRATRYNLSKDPAKVYDYIAPGNRYQKNPKVPASVTVQAVFGARMVSDYMSFLNIPVIPSYGSYIKPDKQTPPPSASHDDMLQRLSTTQDDIPTILNTFQQTYNEQTASLYSSLSPSDYRAGAKQFYSTLDAFWKRYSPTFYQGDWHTFYHDEVLPALK